MRFHRLRSLADWEAHVDRTAKLRARRQEGMRQLEEALRASSDPPVVDGYSQPARQTVAFEVTLGDGPCNWRETLRCPVTGLIHRVRGALHVFDLECSPYDDDAIYLMEQRSPLYFHLAERFPALVASEFFGAGTKPGTIRDAVRHEDATDLSFADASFDHVLHFEVFEHVPDYRRAFAECYRVLRPGGRLLWTVPFVCNRTENTVRAEIGGDSEVRHLLAPEYHGDPINPDGVLCFYHFGWEMLADVRRAGFLDAYAVVFWSKSLGYLGEESIVFVAHK